jgi:RNA polymerase sigma-70 factor (ECF subfamily)
MAKTPVDLLPTRWSLVNRLKNWDDQESWKTFFDTYWRLIYSIALKAGLTEAEAQEVVQETAISVAKKMADFKANPAAGKFRGWLLQVTRRRIVDQLRKRLPHGGTHRDGSQTNCRTATVERIPDPAGLVLESVWEEEWQNNILETALERLKPKVNPKQFQIFHMLVIKRLPPEQVAAVARVNTDNVYLIKHRLSALLKKEIHALEEMP